VRLVSFDGGFGRLEGAEVVPMGRDLLAYLHDREAADGDPIPVEQVSLLAPIPSPGKIVGIGLNYRDHADESGMPVPDEPIMFAKFSNSVIGPGEAIVVPRATKEPDYEAELGVVIGLTTRAVSVEDALDHVFGYTCMNDVSARDLQLAVSQWTRGKAIDTFLPIGPYIVTGDEIDDPQTLDIRCELNGETVQHSNTAQMVFGVAELVSFISQTLTLSPGDVIATGTPAGVGWTRTPPVFLRDGDSVTIEIESVGRLTNPVRYD
jgi:2-keto-4-pentenoate hydratase/2-oxohepta-3-ene-1,7-dioic acid hydratase in catechol pathway